MIAPQTTAENISFEIDWFGNGEKSVRVDFPYGGVDDSNNLSLQTGVSIDEASLKISTINQPPTSTEYPFNLTVDFGGDKLVEWQWRGPAYGQFGRQTLFTNDKTAMSASLGKYGPYNDTVTFRLPKAANVKSATVNLSAGTGIGTQGKILVLNADYSYYGFDVDPVNRLKAFNKDFSIVDRFDAYANTPTWDDIKDYSAILTYNNYMYGYGYKDPKTTGDLLADYVDAGGSLVCGFSAFYNGYGTFALTGRFGTGGYYALPPSGSTVWSYYNALGVKAVIPNHPLMANVTDINTNPNFYQYCYRSGSTPDPAATVVANWIDGYPLALTKNVGGVERVDINLFPVSSQASGTYTYPYYTYTNDGDDLMKNSLLYGGRRPIDFAVDLLNDTTEEFNRTNVTGNYTFPDFSAALNNYLASANVVYTDKYGNDFVDVPINVSAKKLGSVKFDNLNIVYDYTSDIKQSPATGDLATSLTDLHNPTPGTDNVTIPIVISSETAGHVKLHDLHLKMSPPVHRPIITSFFPAATTAVKENSQLDFGMTVIDWYGNPMTTKWFFDGAEVPDSDKSTFSHFFNYESAGEHTAKVVVNNGLSSAQQGWTVTVLDVNRPPSVADFYPAADPTIDENMTYRFWMNGTDPDRDTLTYKWMFDGKLQPSVTGNNFLVLTDFTSAGDHTVKAQVLDPSGLSAGKNWTIHVVNANLPPQILGFAPKTNPRILERETAQFSVTPFDPDGQTLTTTWYLDDAQAFVGNPFVYGSDYKSAGVHTIRATVSDGVDSVSHIWEISVTNVNRVPLAAIDSPSDAEFMQGTSIHFSAKSSSDPDGEPLIYSWKEGGVNVSDQVEFDRAFPPGIHTLTFAARDPSGGVSSTSVRFRVRFVEISVLIGFDRLETVSGDNVDLVITLSNVGDATANEVELEVLVDGKSLGTKSYAEITAGGGSKELFKWKATRGEHTVTAKVGDQTWTKGITVAKAPEVKSSTEYGTYLWPALIIVVAVVIVSFGAAVLRKK
jgi:hypothetical protein